MCSKSRPHIPVIFGRTAKTLVDKVEKFLKKRNESRKPLFGKEIREIFVEQR